jgi:beta-glucanase (GH16 family)
VRGSSERVGKASCALHVLPPSECVEPVADDFHIFGIEWEPEIIRWTIDGEVFHTATPETLYGGTWVFDHDFFILINVAVGGNWPGNPNDSTEFPQEMLVDWVRVYQRS